MRWIALLLLCGCTLGAARETASGAPLQLPAPTRVQLTQKIGAAMPLGLTLQDSDGSTVSLHQLFAGPRAVIVVPGYYRCTVLCGLVMQGVLEALARSGLPRDAWRIVGFSIDPEDTPATARARLSDYLGYARFVDPSAPAPELHLLSTDVATADRLVQALGYAVERPAPGEAIAHSAAFIVATPEGRVARYFPGVRYDAQDVRQAVLAAAHGGLGTPSERLTLLCGHYDPVTGRYNLAVITWIRMLGCAGALGLGLWIWCRRHPHARRQGPAS